MMLLKNLLKCHSEASTEESGSSSANLHLQEILRLTAQDDKEKTFFNGLKNMSGIK